MKPVDELLLDFDSKRFQKRMSVRRIGFVARLFRLRVRDVEAYRTRNGVHVVIKLDETLHPLVAVLLQSLMGSDYARESYNAIRVFNLMSNPSDYPEIAHELWNVLFYKKCVNGEETSKETYDEELTERLRRELLKKRRRKRSSVNLLSPSPARSRVF